MELDAVDIIFPVFQRHDLSFGADGCHGQHFGEVFRIDYPGVVSPDGNPFGQSPEDIVFFERNTFIPNP